MRPTRAVAVTVAGVLAASALALAACSGGGTSAPWVTDPGVAGHARYLPLANTVHDPGAAGATIGCDDCHGRYDTFRKFDCTTSRCHLPAATDAIHVGVVADYPQPVASADCYRCHPTGVGSFPDHPRFFPIGAGTAHDLGCARCHLAYDLASRRDPANLGCAACHAQTAGFATKHGAVKDYDATSPGCVRCHGDSQVDRVAAHAQFPIAPGSTTHDTACLHCHPALRTDKPFAADLSRFDCLGCHAQAATDPIHTAMTGYSYASSACYGCHKDGTSAPANHPLLFPIGAASAHAGVSCTACHGPNNTASPVPAAFQCAQCHQTRPGWSTAHAVTGYAILLTKSSQSDPGTPVPATSDRCLRCHADSQVDRVASHPGGESAFGKGQHRAAGCLTCHTALRTDKPFPAASLDSADGCRTCHPNGTGG